jgi:hypothetical protein
LGKKLKEYNFHMDEGDDQLLFPDGAHTILKPSKTKSDKDYQREYEDEMQKGPNGKNRGRRGREIGDEFSTAMQSNRQDRLMHNVKTSKPKMASCLRREDE